MGKKHFFFIVYACFCEGGGFAPALASIRKSFKNNTLSKTPNEFSYLDFRVRDSSGKPAMSEANEDLQRIARPEAQAKGHAQKNY
jgi:hypothetical protein